MSSVNDSPPMPLENSEAYTGNQLVAVAITFIVLEIIFVMLRIFARFLSKANAGLDDIMIIPALISCLAIDAICLGRYYSASRTVASIQN